MGYREPRYLRFFRDLYDGSEAEGAGLAPWAVARSGISTTPTISVRNLPVVFTGAPVAGPGSTGIPNFHFVDRSFSADGVQQGRAYYFYGNDALELSFSLTASCGNAEPLRSPAASAAPTDARPSTTSSPRLGSTPSSTWPWARRCATSAR